MKPLTRILNSINNKTELLDREFIESEYSPFIINRMLSYSVDTSLYAHEINRLPNMPVYDQYLFYYHAIPKRKRFFKYHKKTSDKYIEAISEYYGYSSRKAHEVAKLLNEDQLKVILSKIDKGGVKK